MQRDDDRLNKPITRENRCDIETMRLLVDAEKQRRIDAGEEPFNCIVVDVKDRENTKNYYALLKEKSAEAKQEDAYPIHMQAIIGGNGHFLTIDVMFSQEADKFLILDAAGDPRGLSNSKKLMQAHPDFIPYIPATTKEEKRMIGNGIQTQDFGCAGFALDHACQVSWIDDVFDRLDEHVDNNRNISWDQMPAELVWNAQSMRWLEHYQKLHVDQKYEELPYTDSTFSEIIGRNLRLTTLTKEESAAGKKQKQFNNSVVHRYEDYQAQGREHLGKYVEAQKEKEKRSDLASSYNKHSVEPTLKSTAGSFSGSHNNNEVTNDQPDIHRKPSQLK